MYYLLFINIYVKTNLEIKVNIFLIFMHLKISETPFKDFVYLSCIFNDSKKSFFLQHKSLIDV